MVTKVTFVGPSFTRKAPKYERFIRPTGLRFTKANVTHPELQVRPFAARDLGTLISLMPTLTFDDCRAGYVPAGDTGRQKESAVNCLHFAWRDHKGYCDRGQRERAGSRNKYG
jgi:hypothetical protein